MSREIKFRAKSKQEYTTSIDGIEKGDWVYGYYFFDRVKMCGIIKTTMTEECGGVGSGIVQVDIEVDIKTIGEFTGVYDQDDKEIYDGDIIQSFYGEQKDADKEEKLTIFWGKVIFNQGSFIADFPPHSVFLKDIDSQHNVYWKETQHITGDEWFYILKGIKITGNIYDKTNKL